MATVDFHARAGLERGEAADQFLRALHRLAVQARDQVAGSDARFEGRAFHQDIDHGDAAAGPMPSCADCSGDRSCGMNPSQPRITWPCFNICSITPRTRFTGIAKPMPSGPPEARFRRPY